MKIKTLFTIPIITLVILISCSSPGTEEFVYHQDFSPDPAELKDPAARLEFNDVREELLLSSWGKASWELADNGVRVVGSRNAEVRRREKLAKDVYEGNESFVLIREFRMPWLTLSMGDLSWTDYTATTTLTIENQSIAGIAVRYINSREYYAFVLDIGNEMVKLVLRKMDKEGTPDQLAWIELKTTPYKILADNSYKIQVDVKGDQIICSIDDTVVIEMTDTYRSSGKVALIADDPVVFGPVSVEGIKNTEDPYRHLAYDIPEPVYEIPLPGGDIDRRFWFTDPDTDGTNEIIIAESDGEKYSYRCLEFDGTELWRIDDMEYPFTEAGDFTMQVFDINGDGKNELLTCIDFEIQVREGATAKLLKSVLTPEQNPYYDSRDYPYPRLLGDALCPVKISPDEPKGFYIKDRYTNIWLYDHNLNQLWHKALSTAHFPLPVDVDGDGIEEIMTNHTLLKADGSVIWSLPLSDHSDNIAHISLNPGKDPKYFYIAGGEMGLLKIDPVKGELLNRFELGHIQAFTISDWLPEKEGLELLTVTTWREDRIHYLFDKDLNMISTWQAELGGTYPVPWGPDGSDLALIGTRENYRLADPLTGEVLYVAPGRLVGVFADERWGNVLMATEEENHLKLYVSPNDSKFEPIELSLPEIRSGYLPILNTSLNN